MKQIILTLKLLDPIVISQSNKTEGMHSSLDYLPGSNILGAFASKLYPQLKKDNKEAIAQAIFHSGQVRFNNAYPLKDGQTSQPMPNALHYKKGGDKTAVFNNVHGWNQLGEQPKQLREGYITQSLDMINPTKNLHLRTAINPQTGVAADGQLFGYQSIQAGTQFQCSIDIDDETTLSCLLDVLKDLKQIRLGRSKSAQYGRVAIEKFTKTTAPSMTAPIVKIDDQDCLVFWLASDLVVYNQLGQPTLNPSLSELGLIDPQNDTQETALNTQKSFIRTRKYSPYNSFRRSYDMEQQVIQQGSLLVYPKTDIDLTKLQKGLGCYTETGKGQTVNLGNDSKWQALFTQEQITLNKIKKTTPSSTQQTTPLTDFLIQKQGQRTQQQAVDAQVKDTLKLILSLYKSIRQYNGIPAQEPAGPSKTQWGRIRDAATQGETNQAILEALFEKDDAIIPAKDKDWALSDNQNSFRSLLKEQIKAQINKFGEDNDLLGLYLRSLAKATAHNDAITQARGGQA